MSAEIKTRSAAEVLGPGMWFMLEQQAFLANTDEEKRAFIRFLKNTATYHPCHAECAKHSKEYIKMHPPEEWMKVFAPEGTPNGFLLYVVNMHNTVNLMKGVPEYDYRLVYRKHKTIYDRVAESSGGPVPCLDDGKCSKIDQIGPLPPILTLLS